MILYIDRNGRVKQIKYVELNSRSYVTTARNARDIDYLNTADGLTLTVLCRPPSLNIWDFDRAQISIRWKGIPFEQFQFTDNRQKAIEKVETLATLSLDAFKAIKKNRTEEHRERISEFLSEKEALFLEMWFSDEARRLLKQILDKF